MFEDVRRNPSKRPWQLPGDHPWHIPFPSPPGTPNNDPTSSGSEADNNDPLEKIAEVKQDLKYLCAATDWWETKCEIHGQVMGNLTNKLNKAYAREVKQTMKAKSRRAKLDSLKMFRDYASVISPYYNWSQIDVAGVWRSRIAVAKDRLIIALCMQRGKRTRTWI
ncbi:unnamed protein product [Prunus brigantina]